MLPHGNVGRKKVKPRKHFRRWRSYDPTNSLRTPTMKESQLLREKNHFLGLCFNMFKRCAYPVSLTCIHTQQQAMCSPWAYLKKASGSWLLFQIEQAKVWSPRWVENDKRKRFGGVVENFEVKTLCKNRFFLSVRQGRRRGMWLHDTVGVDLFVIYRGRLCDLPPMSGHGLDGRACLWNTEVFALLLGNVLDVPEWLNDILAS